MLLLTAVMAYLVNFIFEAPIVWAWVGTCLILFSGYVGEYVKFRRDQSPTLLAEKVKVLEEKLRKKEIEGDQIKNLILENEFLKSELEDAPSELEAYKSQAKAAFEMQKAETDKSDAKALEYKANWENAEAEKSDLKAKLSEAEANAKQWAAEKSSAEKAFQDSLKITKNNHEQSQRVIDGLQANVAFLEAKQSQYAHATSELVDKFGYGIFSNDWEIFKPAMNRLTTKYNTNKLNATTSQESRQALMLTAETVETIAEFLPQEAELVETLNAE